MRPRLSVEGTVVRGHGAASGAKGDARYPDGTLAIQIPIFRRCGLDLTSMHPATINVDISPMRLVPIAPPFTFTRVAWTEHIPPETFSFFHCVVTFAGVGYDGWVYLPHPETKVEHFQDPSIVEVITAYIDGLAVGARVTLSLDPREAAVEAGSPPPHTGR